MSSEPALQPILASELYALSQNSKCLGGSECHWCAGPCPQLWIHDGPPPVPFVKAKDGAKRPANHYICAGCWLWRRKRITINFLDESYKDGQCPLYHNWLITDNKARAIRPADYQSLYNFLLKPSLSFSLSFVIDPTIHNQLHLATANHHVKITGETELFFTINNVKLSYTIYDLQTTIETRDQGGKMPGVRELVSLLGWPPVQPEEKRERGRPAKPSATGSLTRKLIAASGVDVVAT